MDKHTKIREILKRLKKAYGSPRPYKATDPVDELIRTVLSQNTNDKNSLGAFAAGLCAAEVQHRRSARGV